MAATRRGSKCRCFSSTTPCNRRPSSNAPEPAAPRAIVRLPPADEATVLRTLDAYAAHL